MSRRPPRRPSPAAGRGDPAAGGGGRDGQEAGGECVQAAGGHPTQVIDRFWFRSIYFREPAGVLFEIATPGPGFTPDEGQEHPGEERRGARVVFLSARPRGRASERAGDAGSRAGRLTRRRAFEHLRGRVEPVLTP